MKFLVDNQLRSALAQFLQVRGFEAVHVLDAGFAQASDIEICRHAELHDHTLVSKDEDFFHLPLRPGATFALIWVRIGNCRKQTLLDAFERAWPRIIARMEAGERIIELR